MEKHKPEIMSPAGYWPQLHAAIEAGADAVYFGLTHFTARAKVGFTLIELPDVMQTLHRRGVKGYVTFNTLVFDHELDEAVKALAEIAAAGADSIIVQDVAVAQLARQIAPDLAIHGSTQMSITSAEGIALAQQFGVSRVVLARELSLDEVRAIRTATDCELEMFVHGALCVSYSGQCFSSEAWGGRSANRGKCAQACRLPYEMIVDDQLKPLGDARYLLSPGDLYALHQIPEIVEIGISALKIEGRYKDANYVTLTTRAYRQAVDAAWHGRSHTIDPVEEIQLTQVYSRGLGAHFVSGTNHQTVVNGRSPNHRGVKVGVVQRVLADGVLIQPEPVAAIAPIKPGDGLVFDAADWRSPTEPEEGGFVYEVRAEKFDAKARSSKGKEENLRPSAKSADLIEFKFGNGQINFGRIRPGDWVWRTHDPELEKAAKPFTQASQPVQKRPLSIHATAYEGQPLTLTWTLDEQPHIQVTVQSPEPLPAARNQSLSLDFAREQLGRLGNTPYELANLTLDVNGRPFAPASLLNNLRRDAVEQLQAQQAAPPATKIQEPTAVLHHAIAHTINHLPLTIHHSPFLHLLVRTPEQLAAALDLQPASITLDYLDLYGLRPAVEQVQAAGIEARVASPRILKPDEQRIVNFLLRLDCAILVRSTGLLHALQGRTSQPLHGDFSLNAANALSAHTFFELGLARLAPTHDLNAAQITALGTAVGPGRLEVIAYHHLPVFHTEHCVFCRFLSEGTSYKDCGTPCEKHKVALRDVHGRSHPVMADVGCRNTVFGAEAQTGAAHLADWQKAGIGHFRLEFVHETAEQVSQVTEAFRLALAGKMREGELNGRLLQIAPQGTTEGSLFVPDNYLTLPVLQ
ncbi:MAG: U32 family peptidase [Ardenticatenaceae bacterium]|nr:U32 family peptidase [Ardenticatenaceae bacterium]